jgi:hypothetical protein
MGKGTRTRSKDQALRRARKKRRLKRQVEEAKRAAAKKRVKS